MLSMIKESSQNALERYFARLGEGIYMTQQAFSAARQKIKWEAFQALFEYTVNETYKETHKEELKTWHGYRVLAIDGSKINLPQDKALKACFGTSGAGNTSAAAQGSLLYDIENDLIVDALIEPAETDERSLAKRHIEKLVGLESCGKEIVLFDRGYPSLELIRLLEGYNLKYVMRVRQKFNAGIDALPRGDAMVTLNKDEAEEEEVRVIKFRLPGGEIETLITNLVDKSYRTKNFKALYFKRWPIETKYDELKKKLELENFSGKLADNIRQDFYAMIFLSNIASILYKEAQEEVEAGQRNKENKYRYQVNANHEIGVLKDRLIYTLLEDDSKKRGDLFEEIVGLLEKRIIPIRPGRSIPRQLPRKVKFHHNHKSNC